MRFSAFVAVGSVFAMAAAAALFAASYSVQLVEDLSEIGVRDALDAREMTWAEVQADGLQVVLSGTAPSEADRFAALSTVGGVVDAARVIDNMSVKALAALAPPRFSTEILRNDAGLSVIGLVPESTGLDELRKRFASLDPDREIADFVETAGYPPPDGWEDAMAFALSAVETLPRAKVSVEANYVAVTAIADSPEQKERFERDLMRNAPPGLRIALDISAPRPVITPFTLRFVIDEEGTRFDACSADSVDTRTIILEAARAAGMNERGFCDIGLGVPSPTWGNAVTRSINALAEIGAGTVTFVDADITLIAAPQTASDVFERVVGELENALPDLFVLHARLPEAVDPNAGPPEFLATLSPEGNVQLRGRLSDENLRRIATSYAQAAFGSDRIHTAARIVEDLPSDWSVRVLTGLEALALLSNGALTVEPDHVRINGNTGNADAAKRIASLFAAKLGDAGDFDIDIRYQEKLDPTAALPTPDECEAEIAAILTVRKISFEPGSATIDSSALGTLDDIAEILKRCGPIRLEIQGHTDSQGRESMNQQLSQARATSVLNELRARRVLTSTYAAKGYGETTPIADNKTEEGRELNRRIEFRLIRPNPASVPEGENTLEELADSGNTTPAEDQSEEESQ